MNRPKIQNLIISSFVKTAGFVFTHPEWSAFIVVFGMMLWMNLSRSDFEFYGDAFEYWRLAKTFENPVTRIFSFLNFNSELRGYLFPLILYSITKLSTYLKIQDKVFLEIVQSFVFSGLIAIIIPYTLKKLFRNTPNFWQIMLFCFFVVLFWQGHLFYPLSDFWALSFLIFGLYLLLYYGGNKWVLFLTGALFGGATVIRPSYSITLIFLLIWSAHYLFRHKKQDKKQVFINEFIITIGMVLVFIPQFLINIDRFGIWSPMPLARSASGESLFLQQLTWGIQIQRFEGVLGLKAEEPLSGLFFVDQHGSNVLVRSGLEPKPFFYSNTSVLTLSKYTMLVLRHPLDFLVIYAGHLFNGLDIVYNTPYIPDLHKNTAHIRLLNYSLWFLAILYISKRIRIFGGVNYLFFLFLILALPAILSIPTAMEVRYMLPFHLVSYSMAAFFAFPDFFSVVGEQKKRFLFKYLLWYCVFVVICFLLSINVFTSMMPREIYVFW